jgi:DNA-binding NtrC family response regulator
MEQKILIMDNGERFRNDTARCLYRRGMEVVTATSFAEAIAARRKHDIGVVVTELLDCHGNMLVGSYLDALRQDDQDSYLPIIARTHIDNTARKLAADGRIDILLSKSYAQADEFIYEKAARLLRQPEAYRGNLAVIERPRPVREQDLGVRIHDHYGTTKQPRHVHRLRDI